MTQIEVLFRPSFYRKRRSLLDNHVFLRKVKWNSLGQNSVLNPYICMGQRTITTTLSSHWFVTWQPLTVFPQAAPPPSSCFASPSISEMKSHIFSQHAGMARPHYSTHWGIHSSAHCTVTSPKCCKSFQWKKLWLLPAPPSQATVQITMSDSQFEVCLYEVWAEKKKFSSVFRLCRGNASDLQLVKTL